jgi:hypothetical protein
MEIKKAPPVLFISRKLMPRPVSSLNTNHHSGNYLRAPKRKKASTSSASALLEIWQGIMMLIFGAVFYREYAMQKPRFLTLF